jgi:hypothetical protein
MTNRASYKVRETIINLIPYVLFVCVFAVWAIILKSEFQYVLVWWAALLFIGLMYYPLSNVFFSSFTDRGFLLSKTIGLAVSSYILWLMSFIKVLPVSRLACFGAAAVPGILLYIHALSSRLYSVFCIPYSAVFLSAINRRSSGYNNYRRMYVVLPLYCRQIP